jgi:predicted phage baseplate assembly protein
VTGVISVTNPLSASGGADAELLDDVRQLAPQAFRAVQYRAVLPADYQTAAETLPWVLRAGTVFRWTGSWLTVFTTPDPIDNEQVKIEQRTELIDLLNRYRMAGYESYVPDPTYLSLDLFVEVCAQPNAFQSNVEQGVLAALGTSPSGFFNHNKFTFGQPLQLSALEAAIQAVNGVAGVTCVRYRIRGRTLGFVRMLDTVSVGVDEILRCDNDPSLPNNGSLQLVIQGGR